MDSRVKGCFAALFIVVLIGSVCLNFGLLVALLAGTESSGTFVESDEAYREKFYSGNRGADDKILLMDLDGVITSSYNSRLGSSMVDSLTTQLRQARNDDQIKAIILRINSPGGEVVASDFIYHEVKKTREVKPVIIYMETMAASGGLYAAMGGTYIMACDLTITGSIGVIIQSYNMEGLADKVGVEAVTFKSGPNKDILNAFRQMTPEESAIIQGLVEETYTKFLGIVADQRQLNPEEMRKKIADGRILSGEQALAAKLVDGLGYLEDAIEKATELGEAEKPQVVRYSAPFSLARLFGSLGQSPLGEVKIDILPKGLVEPGQLYYLSSHLFLGQ